MGAKDFLKAAYCFRGRHRRRWGWREAGVAAWSGGAAVGGYALTCRGTLLPHVLCCEKHPRRHRL